MKKTFARALVVLSASVGGLGQAHAATTWSFLGTGTETGAGAAGNTLTYAGTGDGGQVTLSAWSNSKDNTSTGAKYGYIESAYLGSYPGGLGVRNKDATTAGGDASEANSPGHTMDNASYNATSSGNYTSGSKTANVGLRSDSILLDFGVGNLAKLSSVTIGWWKGDSDIFVLAYTGTGTPNFTTPSSSLGYADLLNNGWRVVRSDQSANYMDMGKGAQASTNSSTYVAADVNNANVSARYWLIGALSSAFYSGADVNADNVKLAGVSAQVTRIPEPGNLALLAGALASGVWLRRRSKG